MTEQRDHQLVEITDPDIDPEQIMVSIRHRMRAERKERQYDLQNFPEFGQTAMLDELADLNVDAELLRHIQRANESNAAFDMSPVVVDSPATRVPILGRLWRLIRSNAHQLVLFYINRATKQQISVNKEMLNVINRMTVLLHEQQELIDELRVRLNADSNSASPSIDS